LYRIHRQELAAGVYLYFGQPERQVEALVAADNLLRQAHGQAHVNAMPQFDAMHQPQEAALAGVDDLLQHAYGQVNAIPQLNAIPQINTVPQVNTMSQVNQDWSSA
jgi:hypothetical protein